MSTEGALCICVEKGGGMVPILRISSDIFSKDGEINLAELTGGSAINFKDIMSHINVQKFNDMVEAKNEEKPTDTNMESEKNVGGSAPVTYPNKGEVDDYKTSLFAQELSRWYNDVIQ